MRIGVNTLPLFPGQIGGMEAYTTNLLTHLTAHDRQHSYHLFVARYNRHLFDAHSQLSNVFTIPTLSLQCLRYAERGAAKVAGVRRPATSPPVTLTCQRRRQRHMLSNIRTHKLDPWFCPLINLAPSTVAADQGHEQAP